MIYTLMLFPCAASCKFVSVKSDTGSDMHPSFRLDSGTGFYLLDMGLIEKLVTLSSGIATDKKLLHKIFDEFPNLWMRMKVYAKTKSDYDTKQFMVVVHWGWQHDLSAWANGSARIRMGNTDVIASVKAELGKLSLLLSDKGKVSIYTDCSSIAKPAFEVANSIAFLLFFA
ncbi:hypothetical protein RIF29_15476 [Crotalaria pallida]|uniref:Uncharacterized protein n=1 Tax=Crotalaria pallida TaxID=3830 RepID=A0AAN9IJ62_CROPI